MEYDEFDYDNSRMRELAYWIKYNVMHEDAECGMQAIAEMKAELEKYEEYFASIGEE